MNKLSAIISFIKEKRKILASLFLTIGIFSALIDVLILTQRPQTYRSKAAEQTNQAADVLQNTLEFISPKKIYSISYDKRYWTVSNFGPRVIFNLNKEYGSARLDISEGESDKDLNILTDEIIKSSASKPTKVESVSFKEKPASLLTFKEQVIGQEVYFEKLIVKEGNKFVTLEKRTPKLGYNESYLDNLLQNFSFNNLSKIQQVKGISSFSNDLTTVELVDLVRPSIANIVYTYCLDVVNLDSKHSFLSRPNYKFCSVSKGSGFIINEKGAVATNGHVARVYPEEGLVTNLLNQGSRDFTYDLIRGVHASRGQNLPSNQLEQFYQDLNLNPQYLDRFLMEIFNLVNKKSISVTTSNEKYYVNVGNEPISVDYQKIQMGDWAKAVTPSSTTYTAKLVDFDYPNKYSYEAIVNKNYQRGADVALLQIENSKDLFPALDLGSIENLKEGSDVVIAGYPTLVEGETDPRAALSYKTSTKPTVTKGIVSAIKQDLSGKTVLQTDASIDHGNSGGPAFNSSAQVVGIATFMTESKTGNFNFLRDVQELKDLMAKNKIENSQGKLTNYWKKGLAEYRDQYFNSALKNFKEVEKLSLSHPTVKEFIESSGQAISEGKSLEGLASFIKGRQSNTMLVIFGGIAVVNFMMAGFLTILPIFAKENTNTPYL